MNENNQNPTNSIKYTSNPTNRITYTASNMNNIPSANNNEVLTSTPR